MIADIRGHPGTDLPRPAALSVVSAPPGAVFGMTVTEVRRILAELLAGFPTFPPAGQGHAWLADPHLGDV